MKTTLENILEDVDSETLPANWNTFDLRSFSKSKKLWDYQRSAVTNAIKTLWILKSAGLTVDDFVKIRMKL